MKNLTIDHYFSHVMEFLDTVEDDRISRIQYATDPSGYVYLYVMLDNDLYVIIGDSEECVVDKYKIAKEEHTKAVGLEYCITIQELFCAYEDGDIFKIEVSDDCKYELACHIDDGLQCMKLSPDHGLIAAVTGAGSVILMVAGFEIVAKMDLYSPFLGSQQFVSVGWGKKETQFHGSLGKEAAMGRQREEWSMDELPNTTCRPLISWRDDSELFAVCFLHREAERRYFRTYDKFGTLLFSSENLDVFDNTFAWKPLENLIATTMRTADKVSFIFFEKNGLRLKDFTFPFSPHEVTVTDIFWSPDGNIFTTTCKHIEEPFTMVQLWTESNNHLYLKHTINFEQDNRLLYARWAPPETGGDNKNKLILLSLKEFRICSFNWCTNRSRGQTADDLAVVGVIDGYNLLITAFKNGIVPPPMCHQPLIMRAPINAVAFAPDINDETSYVNSNTVCAITSNNQLVVCRRKMFQGPPILYEIAKIYNICCNELALTNFSYALSHFLWYTKDTLLCSVVSPSRENGLIGVLRLRDLDSAKHGTIVLRIEGLPRVDAMIEHIVASPDPDEAYVVADKRVYIYRKDAIERTKISMDETCCQVDVTKCGGEKTKYVVALTHTNRLLVDGAEFFKSILSYFIHTAAFLFTTLQNTLICIPFRTQAMDHLIRNQFDHQQWSQLVEDGPAMPDDLPIKIQDVRRVERNSRIVTALSQEAKTILQMPRGNLECIEPKVLVTNIARDYLNACRYVEAFDHIKKHRMNFNLMYDHDPKLFIDNAYQFIDSIAKSERLGLFLSSLTNEDVTETIYSVSYADRSQSLKQDKTLHSEEIRINKVKYICNVLRDFMESRPDANELIHPIMICILRSRRVKEGLEMALAKVRELSLTRNAQGSSSNTPDEMALNYLMNSVDITTLYNTALSLYDLDLAMRIACKSHRDPKEYIPFLNGLRTMDEHYRYYIIEMHLNNYKSALVHIAKDSNRFDECLKLIRNENLYEQALQLFGKSTKEWKTITRLFAEYSMEQKKFHNAAQMFYEIKDLDQAAQAFILDGNWENAVRTLQQMKLSPAEQQIRYEAAATHLRAFGKHVGAAMILLHCLHKPEEAVTVLCKGRNWKDAMQMAYTSCYPELAKTIVQPEITEHTNVLLLQLIKAKEDFLKYRERLKVLRSRINENRQLVYSERFLLKSMPDVTGRNNGMGTLSDTLSIADSVSTKDTETSATSGRSYRSSKNRRKQERKLLSVKEGSMFEDISLISALFYNVTDVYKKIGEWTDLLETLMKFDLEEIAQKFQDEINSFLHLAAESKSEIWDEGAPTSIQELMKKTNYTKAQMSDLLAPVKSLDRFIFTAPTIDVSRVTVIP